MPTREDVYDKICELLKPYNPKNRPIEMRTSLTSRFFGIGHLTLGKLREFRYEDWSSQDVIQDATPFIDALRETAVSYDTK